MGYAVVFSGQGMQHPGMLPWLDDGELLAQAAQRLGVRHWRERLDDADWLSNNRNAQVLLTACALAAWAPLARHLPPPTLIAGYSVGELPAFAAAGVFDPLTALDLAEQRATAMDACARACPGGMLGITGLARPEVQRLCAAWGLHLAIDNGPLSVVLGGPTDALQAAEQAGCILGAHGTRLKVAVASHTPLMAGARTAFAQALEHQPLHAPSITLLAGATVERVRHAEQARHALSAQISQTIRWGECMDALHARGVRCVLEVGAGSSLARLWNQQFADVPARSVDEFRQIGGILPWVRKHL